MNARLRLRKLEVHAGELGRRAEAIRAARERERRWPIESRLIVKPEFAALLLSLQEVHMGRATMSPEQAAEWSRRYEELERQAIAEVEAEALA